MKALFKAMVQLHHEKEAAAFLRDLCTLNELEKMAERWEVAQLLHQGLPYREVAKKTGASTATVTRVAHWIKNGEGGYRKMLKS
jgi:TrpR-related protein YerC/YecD